MALHGTASKGWRIARALIALSCLTSASHAEAGTARVLQRPDLGVSVIQFEGRIEKGDLARIRALVPEVTRTNAPNQIYLSLHSPGGMVWEAVSIGRYLREQGIGTILLPKATCASACTFIFWAGFDREVRQVRRIMMPDARLGVHRMSISAERFPKGVQVEANKILEFVQERVATLLAYLVEMDVSPQVQRRNFGTAASEIYFLDKQELSSNKVAQLDQSGAKWTLRDSPGPVVQLPPRVDAIQTAARPESSAPSIPAIVGPLPAYVDPSVRARAAALFEVGQRYADAIPPNYRLARSWLKQAAELGDANAANNLGSMYAEGKGVPQNHAEATHWFERAAALGSSISMFNLGIVYSVGKGVAPDLMRASHWFERAAQEGYAAAAFSLGTMAHEGKGAPQDYAEARRWYERAVALGSAEAMINLSDFYIYGKGVARDYSAALQLLKRAVELGNINAANNLGHLYAQGKGVSQDHAEARRWFEEAAAGGVAAAMFNLGHVYVRDQDYDKARFWFAKAASLGDEDARDALKSLSQKPSDQSKKVSVPSIEPAEPVNAKSFLAKWREFQGRKVIVRDCTVTYASSSLSEFTCVVSEGVRRLGAIVAREVVPSSAEWAAWNCAAFALVDKCVATITGTVGESEGSPLLTGVVVEPSSPAHKTSASATGQSYVVPTDVDWDITPQRAMLHLENQGTPDRPTTFAAQVSWGVDTSKGGELGVVAKVQAAAVGFSVAISFRRNTDPELAASHVIELAFTTPDDPSWTVRDVGVLRLKNEEASRGTPLLGSVVPIKDNAFLVQLSSRSADLSRNQELLLQQNWIDLPIRLASGRRAIVALEKGNPGKRALDEAYGQWSTAAPVHLGQRLH